MFAKKLLCITSSYERNNDVIIYEPHHANLGLIRQSQLALVG